MHNGVTNTRSLQEYHIWKPTSLQHWFIQEQSHHPLFFCQVLILSAAWCQQQFLGFSTKLKTRVCSKKASELCRQWDYGERDGSLKLMRSWFSNMIFLQRSGVCDPIMHFIDNQTLHNPVLGPNNQFLCIETIPDSVMWPQSSVLLWRILTALYCMCKCFKSGNCIGYSKET